LKIYLLFGEKVAAYNFPYSKLVEDSCKAATFNAAKLMS